jgi:hypothetical protein
MVIARSSFYESEAEFMKTEIFRLTILQRHGLHHRRMMMCKRTGNVSSEDASAGIGAVAGAAAL